MTHHSEGDFLAPDGLRLWSEHDVPDGARAHLVLVHGYGDHLGRYREMRDALLAQGFAVHAYDVRGHGRSDGPRGGVNGFSDYLAELGAFVASARAAAAGRPVFLVAHSHGALIALAWLSSGAPGTESIRGLVALSPYLQVGFTPPAWKTASARLLSRVLPSLRIPTGVGAPSLSRDEAWQRSTDADPLYGRTGTPRWFTESTRVQGEVLVSGGRIRLPVLMLIGGDDQVASPVVSRRYFPTLGSSDKRLREWPGMRHEMWAEIGKEEVYAETSRWISEHL
jgi:alpha-beta hydrolase superfamily lysophospholipase